MEQQKESGAFAPGFIDPQVDDLLKHSIRTQLQSMLKAKLSVSQRQQLLQQSFVAAMSLVLSDAKVTHPQLVTAFESMYDNAVQSLAFAELSQELLTKQYISATGLIMSPHNCKPTLQEIFIVFKVTPEG